MLFLDSQSYKNRGYIFMKYTLIITCLLSTSFALVDAMERDHAGEQKHRIDQADIEADHKIAVALQARLNAGATHADPVIGQDAPAAYDQEIADTEDAFTGQFDQDEDQPIFRMHYHDMHYHELPEFGMSEEDRLAATIAASLETAHQQDQTTPTVQHQKTITAQAPAPKKTKRQIPAPSIKGTEECQICGSSLSELGKEEARFTKCCGQFICQTDFDKLETRAVELNINMQDSAWRKHYSQAEDFTGWPYPLEQADQHEHAACPYCREYPLEVTPPAQPIAEKLAPATATQPGPRLVYVPVSTKPQQHEPQIPAPLTASTTAITPRRRSHADTPVMQSVAPTQAKPVAGVTAVLAQGKRTRSPEAQVPVPDMAQQGQGEATAHLARLAIRPVLAQIVTEFFEMINALIELALRDSNRQDLHDLAQELRITGDRERFKTIMRTIQKIEQDHILSEDNLINLIWVKIVNTLPAHERKFQILEDRIDRLVACEQRQQILAAPTMSAILDIWQANLHEAGDRVWQMLNPMQKLLYIYRLKLHCQVAAILAQIQE